MIKQFFAALKELFALGAQPAMSSKWTATELQEYEKEQRQKDMVY